MSGSPSQFKDRLTLDEARGQWMDQTRRYLLIRPDALMGLFHNLPEPARRQAFDALAQSIAIQGGDSARAYRAMGGTGGSLLDIVAGSAPQLGWGVWRFESAPGSIKLEVTNSPFATGFGPSQTPVCHAILGMVQAVGAMVLDGPVTATEAACAACGAPTCRFEVRPVGTQP